jgi:phosphate starvation-inducible PhoH-like protein
LDFVIPPPVAYPYVMELTITLAEPHKRVELFGAGDRNLRRIGDALRVRIHARNATLRILGEPAGVAKAAAVVEKLQNSLRGRDDLPADALDLALDELETNDPTADRDRLSVFNRGAALTARTTGQQQYIQAMMTHDMVICAGPAGTGKTYLAVAVAVHLLKRGEIKRICLVRPAVEAGEKLGFLPGDLQAKVNPYLRPLFDAMHDMMTFDQLKRFMINDIVEVIPLAYMRGRTLNNSVVILDEAQNATPTQMFMFLTRMGHGTRMIVTGDDSQVDLDPRQPSGLNDAIRRLRNVPGIAIVRLQDSDIVRHRLVQEVVNRYASLLPTARAMERPLPSDDPSDNNGGPGGSAERAAPPASAPPGAEPIE